MTSTTISSTSTGFSSACSELNKAVSPAVNLAPLRSGNLLHIFKAPCRHTEGQPFMTLSTPETVVARVFRKLGGRQALGTEVHSDSDLARLVRNGLRSSVLSNIERAGFSKQEIEHLIIPARTLRHRKAKREALSLEESDRVVRLARIQALAEDVFGDTTRANCWLREPLGVLDGK
ncbi:MAG: hypothetical protein P8Y53_00240, partial [Pseudolabrys sp.]